MISSTKQVLTVLPTSPKKETRVSWLSNDHDAVVVEKGGQRKVLSIACFGGSNMYDLQDLHARVEDFLKRNPKLWESP
jgi:hypothetical protein